MASDRRIEELRRRTNPVFNDRKLKLGTFGTNLDRGCAMIANAKTLPSHVLAEMKKHFIAGWGGYPLIGTREQIVDGLLTLEKIGLDGTLLNWPRYIDDMRWFQQNVHPLVVQAGLR